MNKKNRTISETSREFGAGLRIIFSQAPRGSQDRMADDLGIPRSVVNRVINARVNPSSERQLAIARYLGHAVHEILRAGQMVLSGTPENRICWGEPGRYGKDQVEDDQMMVDDVERRWQVISGRLREWAQETGQWNMDGLDQLWDQLREDIDGFGSWWGDKKKSYQCCVDQAAV